MYLLDANNVYVCACGVRRSEEYRKIVVEIKFRIEAGDITAQQQARDAMNKLISDPMFKLSNPMRTLYCKGPSKGSQAADVPAAD